MKTITETYQSKDFSTNSIIYRHKDGKHIITHSMHCGEDIGPNHYRFTSIEEARSKWIEIRKLIMARGYDKRI